MWNSIYIPIFVCAPIFLIILEISDKWIGLYFCLILQSICIQNIVSGGVQGLVKYVLKKLLFIFAIAFHTRINDFLPDEGHSW